MKTKNGKVFLLILSASVMTITSCQKEKELLFEGPARNPAAMQQNQTTEGDVCGAIQYADAAAKSRMEAMEQTVQTFISQNPDIMSGNSRTVINIPVVFHVVYNLAEQNISTAQLQSQIDVLNEDFSALNTDIANVPSVFQSSIGNANLHFVLALQDPGGNATTGIRRIPTTVTSFSSNGSVCYTSMGGDDAWPASQYLNIWVCNKSGAAGYSSYPWSGSPASDGIIVGYNFVGRVGTFINNWNYQKGRTVTHEVGHWLGLIHIWGDAACGDDLVGNTPTQSAANGSCPVYPHMSSCSPNSDGDMFMNYMDYTYDACRTMFSTEQVTRMLGYLNGTRAGILTSSGGIAPSGGACNIPSGLIASSVTASTTSLIWASTGAVSYSVHYKPTTSAIWITASTPATSLPVSGLSASTTYEFQVQSICSATSSVYSSSTTFTTLTPTPTCNIPAGLFASSVTSGSATLSWASTGALSYNVQYKPTTSATWITTSSSATSHAVSGLSASTVYEFQVQGVCSSGSSSYSASATFTTPASAPACNVPGGLIAYSVTSGGATLSWSATGAVSYTMQYKSTSSTIWNTISSSSTSRIVSGLSANTYYEFRVQSVCSLGSSAYSGSSTFKTTKRNGNNSI
ncbi:MAG: fibronectin type III domain-containing protein [Bacteroidia bacterium]|nr:fibronectin type III domain-containing protein [Bacteroidia bacterium]